MQVYQGRIYLIMPPSATWRRGDAAIDTRRMSFSSVAALMMILGSQPELSELLTPSGLAGQRLERNVPIAL